MKRLKRWARRLIRRYANANRSVTATLKVALRIVAGGKCPRGGDHSWAKVPAKDGRVYYRCRKCKRTVA